MSDTIARGGQTADIGRGRLATFVRWNGDDAELICGTFLGLTPNGWSIDVGGKTIEVLRDEWDWCLE